MSDFARHSTDNFSTIGRVKHTKLWQIPMVTQPECGDSSDQVEPDERKAARRRDNIRWRDGPLALCRKHECVMVGEHGDINPLANAPRHRSLATAQTDGFSVGPSSAESGGHTLRHSGGTSTVVRSNVNTVRMARGTGSGSGSQRNLAVA